MQMHRSRRTYEPGRPVTPWVFAIARHVFLMKRRSAGRRLRFEERLAAEAKSDDVAARRSAARWSRRTKCGARSTRCRPISGEALLLHHVQGWSFAEIAARLGIRVNAAKTRAFRGMKKMRGHLK